MITKEGGTVEALYLLGNYIDHSHHQQSDIDLMLLSEAFDHADDHLIGKLWSLTRTVDPRIEPVFVGTQRFHNDHVSTLLERIRQKGIRFPA